MQVTLLYLLIASHKAQHGPVLVISYLYLWKKLRRNHLTVCASGNDPKLLPPI